MQYIMDHFQIKGLFPFSFPITDYEQAKQQVEIAQGYVSWTGFYLVRVPGYVFPITYLWLLCAFGYERYGGEKTWITDPNQLGWGIRKKIVDIGQKLTEECENSNIIKRIMAVVVDPLTLIGGGTDIAIYELSKDINLGWTN